MFTIYFIPLELQKINVFLYIVSENNRKLTLKLMFTIYFLQLELQKINVFLYIVSENSVSLH